MRNKLAYQLEITCKCINCGGWGWSMYHYLPNTPIMQNDVDSATVETLFAHGYLRTSEYDSWVCGKSCLEEYEMKLQKALENE